MKFNYYRLRINYCSGRVFFGSFTSLEGINNFLLYVERINNVYVGFSVESL